MKQPISSIIKNTALPVPRTLLAVMRDDSSVLILCAMPQPTKKTRYSTVTIMENMPYDRTAGAPVNAPANGACTAMAHVYITARVQSRRLSMRTYGYLPSSPAAAPRFGENAETASTRTHVTSQKKVPERSSTRKAIAAISTIVLFMCIILLSAHASTNAVTARKTENNRLGTSFSGKPGGHADMPHIKHTRSADMPMPKHTHTDG